MNTLNKEDFDSTTLEQIKEILDWGNFELEPCFDGETEPAILIGQLTYCALGRVRSLESEVMLDPKLMDSLNKKIPSAGTATFAQEGMSLKDVISRLITVVDRERYLKDLQKERLANIRKELEKLTHRHYQFGKSLLNSLDELKFWIDT
ncbi:hypothetical protein BI308_23075 [Roseofilum reptotaenium AO1-A]|uniref:Uncharacterized protein n=1 Tax=Roseofilum reptotaenium AO1-A TaxID=1925591 RepID=A0A1L9QKI0_9CYAN|nr:hypothetical protein BI308_23075 [Roseofilum reptotaenium AO1-A]